MIASEKVMDALKGIGLNLYERRLWVALLAKGTASAGELAEIANVPRSRCYDTLESLAEKGFVIIQTGKPLKFVAVAPEEALERAKKRIEEKMKALQAKIDKLKSSQLMRELNEIYEKGLKLIQPEEISGALKGKFSVIQQVESMIRDAKKKINILVTSETLNEIFTHHLDVLKRAKERGVEIRIAAIGGEKCLETLKVLGEIADVRVLDTKTLPISGNVVMVDEKELLFGLTDPSVHATQSIAFWTKSQHATSNLMSPLFDLIWTHSKKLS